VQPARLVGHSGFARYARPAVLARRPNPAFSVNTGTAIAVDARRDTGVTGVINGSVVVGVDGSAASEQAVRIAAAEAVGQGRQLCLLHAFTWTEAGPEDGTSPHDATEHLLGRAMDDARAAAPDVAAVSDVAEGDPVYVLLRAAASADLLAIGDGGLASHDCLPMNARAVRITAEAACSVLVARDTAPKPGPVLVGIDRTLDADYALGHAFDIASHRGVDLVILHVTETDGRPTVEPPRAEIDSMLRAKVSSWQLRYPKVPFDLRDVPGEAVRVLADEGASAALVVVGARGDRPTRSLLGAVSMGLLHHAPCPVLVVRGAGPE
jgi:nucleotide-binding universal stress UspA family protein